MGSTSQTFLLTPSTKDFTASGEINIRRLSPVAVTEDATTITAHPAAAGTTSITLNPYTTSSTQSDISINAGWAINHLGSEGMDSLTASVRIIPAGNWTASLFVNMPVAASGSGNLVVNCTMNVYLVTATGARTLVFNITSSNFTQNGTVANNGGLVNFSSNQPELIIWDNETIHIGFVSNLTQTAGVLGAVVAANAAWYVGAIRSPITLPSPGIRTRNYITTADAAVISEILKRITSPARLLSDSSNIADTLIRTTQIVRLISDTFPISDSLARMHQSNKYISDAFPISDLFVGSLVANRGLSDTNSTTESITRKYTIGRNITDSFPISESLNRGLIYGRSVSDIINTISNGNAIVNNFRYVMIFDE